MQRALSFDQTPSLAVPLRFLLTAPAFGLAVALLLLWQGEAVLVSRWAPATLALTHLLTLGFLAMCMVGSLLQILPVVLGIPVGHVRLVSASAHVLLTLGTTALCTGFLAGEPLLFRAALPLLLAAFGLLLGVGLREVWRGLLQREEGPAAPVLKTIRIALLALTVTLTLGAFAASAFGWNTSLPLVLITDLHAAWGLLGWVFLLTAGVAFQVVPMFQSTAPFPPLLTRWLAAALAGLLLAWSVAEASGVGGGLPASVVAFIVAVLVAGFALFTLRMILRRKRPQAEALTRFWMLALGSLASCALIWPLRQLSPAAGGPDLSLLLGALFIAGFGVTVINGMLYKIVPFLAWYHLQHAGVKAPNVRLFLPDARAMLQFRLHLAALGLLLLATLWPAAMARPAGLMFAVSMLMLWVNLWRVLALYRKTASEGADMVGRLMRMAA